MAYDNKNPYQRVNDGVYDSYLNSAIMLPTMFNMVGQVNVPSQFANNVFNSTETVQKALFLDIALVNNTTTNNGNTLVGVMVIVSHLIVKLFYLCLKIGIKSNLKEQMLII